MPYPSQTDLDAIVTTACQMIEQDGIDALSLARLAEVLGIKAPSLYRHVSGKPELLRRVVERTLAGLFAAFDEALSSAGDEPVARLQALFRAYRRYAHAHPETYVLAFTTTIPEQRADPDQLVGWVLPVQSLMAQITGQEQSLPALRGALALVHGFVMLELKGQLQRGGDLNAAFEDSITAYLRGWKAQG